MLMFQMIYSSRNMSASTKKSHFISSAACWLLPIIPVIVAWTSKEKYNVEVNMRFCFLGSSRLVYFTHVIILEVAQAVGCTCLFAVAYKLYTVRQFVAMLIISCVISD